MPSWILFILECGEEIKETEWTSFAGNLLPRIFLMFAPIIRLYTTVNIYPFHGKLWKLNVPTKVSFFLLTVVWERISTTDNLQRQQIVVIDWCCMYKRAGDSSNHLLLHCLVATELWNMVFSLFGIYWAMPKCCGAFR